MLINNNIRDNILMCLTDLAEKCTELKPLEIGESNLDPELKVLLLRLVGNYYLENDRETANKFYIEADKIQLVNGKYDYSGNSTLLKQLEPLIKKGDFNGAIKKSHDLGREDMAEFIEKHFLK